MIFPIHNRLLSIKIVGEKLDNKTACRDPKKSGASTQIKWVYIWSSSNIPFLELFFTQVGATESAPFWSRVFVPLGKVPTIKGIEIRHVNLLLNHVDYFIIRHAN